MQLAIFNSFSCFLDSSLLRGGIFLFYASQTFQMALVISVSLPDVEGALPPTVTVAFVDAAPTIWRVKISAFTHKPSP
jgi:hypothetical protein